LSRYVMTWNRTAEGVGEPRPVPRVGDYSEPRVRKSERKRAREIPSPAATIFTILST